jgi:murein DD-endopeptidase MepM/ murein hydrolase activator NlpD
MNTRKLAAALAAAGVATVGLGATVKPAEAVPRTFQVTLLTGAKITITVDLPPGQSPTPGSLGIPGVASITEITPPAPPAPEPPAPAPEQPAQPQQPQQQPAQPTQTQPQQQATTPNGEPKPKNEGGAKGTKQKSTGEQARDAIDGAAEDVLGGAVGETAKKARKKAQEERERAATRLREPDGEPAQTNPGLSLAEPGAAPIGVPNFFIDKFRIPPFLLSIYQAAGVEYGIRWEVLAAINEIETDYGRNLNVSSAGALGWMQFMPATWKQYGTDANGDKKKDPYNPVDAIFAAARYLKAAGAEKDLRRAIFAYNHADWYVDSVLMRARIIGGLPTDLVGSLTGLTQGLFPVHAKARYADDLSEREATKRVAKGKNAALPIEASSRRGINIYADAGSPAVAVQDGKIVNMGRTKRLGKFIKLRDAFGNTYTYAHLDSVADRHPVPKPEEVTPEQVRKELKLPSAGKKKDPKPTQAASAGTQKQGKEVLSAAPEKVLESTKERLFASPKRPEAFKAGGEDQLLEKGTVDGSLKDYVTEDFGLSAEEVTLKRLKVGSKVIGGTILGRIGRDDEGSAPHMLFEIRPAGRGAPRIDPKPILDGWKLLETTAIYRAKGKNPFFGRDAANPSVGQILLMGKSELQKRVLSNPRIEIYGCGERDIEGSRIDRRVLATLEFLAASGLRPTVTSLQCGHSLYTASGNVSHHSTGSAVDIAKINGVPIMGNQGKGSVTDITIQRLLTLQGTMKPAQIISLMKYDGQDNTLAMADHADHIHVGFQPQFGANTEAGRQLNAVLKPGQWIKLIDRLGEIDNPTVREKPSKYALSVKPARASRAHKGE